MNVENVIIELHDTTYIVHFTDSSLKPSIQRTRSELPDYMIQHCMAGGPLNGHSGVYYRGRFQVIEGKVHNA